MEFDENSISNQKDEFANLNVKDVDSYMNHLETLLETLLSGIKILPKVDEKGQSECSFARLLYTQKEEAAEQVTEELREASRYMTLLDQENKRIRENLGRIEDDAKLLNLDQAKEEYQRARRAHAKHIDQTIQQKDRLIDLIARADELLQHAQKKEWPGEKPTERLRPSTSMARGLTGVGVVETQNISPAAPFSPKQENKAEIDSLISLGPLN